MTISFATFAILVLGAAAPGCLWEEDDSLGRFCAKPAGGDEHCVSTKYDPADAWDKAKAYGSLPIQLWATRPGSVSLDQLVESESRLNAWFGELDRATAYVRDTERNAESLRASLDGSMSDLLAEASNRQAARLAQKPVDAVGHLKRALTEKATAEKSPLVATIAGDKQAMTAARAVFDQARRDAAPLQVRYAGAVTGFTAYRATEASETARYVALAGEASASALETIPEVEQAILEAGREASARPNDLSTEVMALSAELQAFAVSYEAAVAPHADFLATHGAAIPDMTSSALRSLNAMLGYAQRRVTRSDATATSLLRGVAVRRDALRLLGANRSTRDAVVRSRELNASARFGDFAGTRVQALSQPPPTSTRLKLPYLAARRDQLTALVQLKPLCDVVSSSWREAGCAAFRGRFGAAEIELKRTLPRWIAAGLSTMRAEGVDRALLDAAQAKLDAGDVKSAALAYDAAVQTSEGT